MSLASGTYRIGPDAGDLHLRTTREGVAAMVGHDLLITFRRWSGSVTVDSDDPTSARIEVEIDLGSLDVLDGTGGVAALADRDRHDITTTALRLLEVNRHPLASFTSANAGASPRIAGTLRLRGRSAPVTLDVTATGPSAWRARATVLQSTFGIKAYRALFGALRLADPVVVEVAVDLART